MHKCIQESHEQAAGRCVPVESPVKAIRRHCLECAAGDPVEVRKCPATTCLLWSMRFGMGPRAAQRMGKVVEAEAEPSFLKTINRYCGNCIGSRQQVKNCSIVDCPLWPFRFGMTPATARKQGKRVDPEAE